jgi:hypothetical protein
MLTLPPPAPLASAAAVFFGHYGAVSALAGQRGTSRQALYREAHAAAAAVEGSAYRRQLDDLRQQLADAHRAAAELRRQLGQAVAFDRDRRAQFAATAQALGVSLSATHALLAVCLGAGAPSRAQRGRLAQAAGRRAAAVLAALEPHSGRRARQVAADEIFSGKKPVLMTVEQESLCWLGGRLASNRQAVTWAEPLRRLPALEQLTRDGAVGLRKAVALVSAERAAAGQAAVADQQDHFHLLQQAHRATRAVRAQAAKALRKAGEAQRALDQLARAGRARPGCKVATANRLWLKAEAAFDRWAGQDRAAARLRAALPLFTPQGELNTRERAEAEVRAALAELPGREWERVRRRRATPETFTFLDRVQERLADVPLPGDVKALVVRAEGLRRRPELLRGEGPGAAALRGVVLATAAAVALLGEAGEAGAEAVRGILRGARRARSLVEGVNSVVRMHQGRQKRLTQGLLDLQRLYWNCHAFRAGKRKEASPYGLLGVVLPKGSWWDLLQKDPAQLAQELSALNPAA